MFAISALVAVAAPKPIDFQREIRPILSDNCFQCHGPDPANRMAGLRLDLKETALEARKNGAAIVPANSASSLLYQRIVESNPAKKMPPKYSHKTVTAEQAALIKRWIDEGAPWKEHWAYTPPRKPAALPAVKNTAWAAANPIDRFILAKLEAQSLSPAPAADKRTLIRRVALDLTGLPPKPAEIDQYLKDTSPNAYEKMVDRYLASPHYGEHRGRYWLDAARYADTHGIHVDNYREMWPYRDWVIRAFNKNMPFDQFTIEQLAGDLLPNPTLDQQIATGFHRCNVTTNEAGIIEDEYAEIYAKDRADTTGAVWLGLTVGCATCHDHKFDPITAKDFYSLGAFFRNTQQKVMDGNIPDTPPVLVVPGEADREKWTAVNARLRDIRKDLASLRKSAQTPAGYSLPANAQPLDAASSIFAADIQAADVNGFNAHLGEAPNGKALWFHNNDGVPVDAPEVDADKPFSISVDFHFPKPEQGYGVVTHWDPTRKNVGWDLSISGRVPTFRIYGEDGKNIELRAGHLSQLKHGTWNHVVITYDGSRQQSGLSMFINGKPVDETQGGGNQNTELRGSISAKKPLLLGRYLLSGAIADFRMFNRVVSESEAALLAQWTALKNGDSNALLTYWLLKENQQFNKLSAEQNALNIEARAIARRSPITHVMREQDDSVPFAHVLYRGAYDQKRQKVEANTPSILPPMKSDLPRNRMGLAKWIVDPENPMPARVTVNRMWQEIFGTGISKSTDDFGSQGEPPVNQDLLDWLAVDFRENKWDVKRFYKQILMSNAYRQSAAATPDKLAKDPDNRLLSRGPRFRMDGEMVRDYALASSGLMNTEIGGPSVKPYQPEGVWEAVAMIGSNTRDYKQDHGDKLYRRSMYTFWKRSAPPAQMEIFNAPTREACTVRRERTNTPLQALVTMNDIQFVEAARNLAERAYKAGPTLDARVDFMSTNVVSRIFTAQEKAIVNKAYKSYMSRFDSHPEEAKKLIAVGEKKADATVPVTEFAALTMLANQLLNLDEVLTK
ncbi:hypothetical protein F183_A06100 [Bryobacterales bacterium F-183]|nr:hypothetical protein F183_A06100 [Bryobacterales bacterium F-183]